MQPSINNVYLRPKSIQVINNNEVITTDEKVVDKVVKKQILDSLPPFVRYLDDKRICFNSFIYKTYPHVFEYRKSFQQSLIAVVKQERMKRSLPTAIQSRSIVPIMAQDRDVLPRSEETGTLPAGSFPLQQTADLANVCTDDTLKKMEEKPSYDFTKLPDYTVKDDVEARLQAYNEGKIKPFIVNYPYKEVEEETPSVRFEEPESFANREEDELTSAEGDEEHYGSADPEVPASGVPCGGCGALLHCRDPSLPGFKPKEVFVGLSDSELRETECQRCYFLTHYHVHLQVRVDPSQYLDALQPIRSRPALVLMLVDLTDAPCSIHPGIMQVIGRGQPVLVVGSKLDLLPMDGPDCVERLQAALTEVVKRSPLSAANVVATTVVSAKSGFGVEELVGMLHSLWRNRGDLYLVGATNSGKSSLFNALLRSDLCRTEATSSLLPATTSPWPGTTLAMLRFPLLASFGRRLVSRLDRLDNASLSYMQTLSNMNPITQDPLLATLRSRVDQTPEVDSDSVELARSMRETAVVGLDEKAFEGSHWCYDTPGAVQPDQFLSLLTHEELEYTLPRSMIIPETYRLTKGDSLFIAGLGRIDLVDVHHTENSVGRRPSNVVLFTVFRSSALPVSVVRTTEAAAFYRDYVGSEVLRVPRGGQARMALWPPLRPTQLQVTGVARDESCADVVLSSAGWAAVTPTLGTVAALRLWTPDGRGAYVRRTPFLARAVALRGDAVVAKYRHDEHKFYDGRLFTAKTVYTKRLFTVAARKIDKLAFVDSATGEKKYVQNSQLRRRVNYKTAL